MNTSGGCVSGAPSALLNGRAVPTPFCVSRAPRCILCLSRSAVARDRLLQCDCGSWDQLIECEGRPDRGPPRAPHVSRPELTRH
eukprot:4938110-Prymnesium_polylepis.1